MPAERIVNCPNCQEPKTTKAAERVRLRCTSCGSQFLAPPVVAASAGGDEPATPDTTSTTPAAPQPGGAVKVVKASSVKVRTNAKTKQPVATKAKPSTTEKPPAPSTPKPKQTFDPPKEPATPDPMKPEHQERSKISGRRGGIGFYNRRIKRHA